MYKFFKDPYGNVCSDCVKRVSDGMCIPFDEGNSDYEKYLKWLDGYELHGSTWVKTSNSNTTLPADE